jgi:tetratricopeptide (TPR) repeat protein
LKALTRFWTFQGHRNYRQKRYSEALKYFETIIIAGSPCAVILAGAAFCMTELKRYDESIALYQRAVQGDVQHGGAYRLQILGNICLKLERW